MNKNSCHELTSGPTSYAKATTGPQTIADLQPWPDQKAYLLRVNRRLLRLRSGGKGRVTTKHPS